jgi:hypothetical protein
MSGHFTVLRTANLITSEKHGATVTYSLCLEILDGNLLTFMRAIGIDIAQQNRCTCALQ